MNFFGIVVVLCTLVVVVVKGDLYEKFDLKMQETLTHYVRICMNLTGSTEEIAIGMNKYLRYGWQADKCLDACVLKQANLMTEDGKLFSLTFGELAHDAKLDFDTYSMLLDIVEICEEIDVPEDHCEAAYLYKTCLFDEGRKSEVDFVKLFPPRVKLSN